MLWVHNAPQQGVSSEEEIAEFIQRHVTCRLPERDKEPLLHECVTLYQRHICNKYCRRRFRCRAKFITVCRFGFPRRARAVFRMREAKSAVAQRNRGAMHKRFYELPRTGLERRINDYNPICGLLWFGNHDVQVLSLSFHISESVS